MPFFAALLPFLAKAGAAVAKLGPAAAKIGTAAATTAAQKGISNLMSGPQQPQGQMQFPMAQSMPMMGGSGFRPFSRPMAHRSNRQGGPGGMM